MIALYGQFTGLGCCDFNNNFQSYINNFNKFEVAVLASNFGYFFVLFVFENEIYKTYVMLKKTKAKP